MRKFTQFEEYLNRFEQLEEGGTVIYNGLDSFDFRTALEEQASKKDLYELAKMFDVKGRSKMNKDELARKIEWSLYDFEKNPKLDNVKAFVDYFRKDEIQQELEEEQALQELKDEQETQSSEGYELLEVSFYDNSILKIVEVAGNVEDLKEELAELRGIYELEGSFLTREEREDSVKAFLSNYVIANKETGEVVYSSNEKYPKGSNVGNHGATTLSPTEQWTEDLRKAKEIADTMDVDEADPYLVPYALLDDVKITEVPSDLVHYFEGFYDVKRYMFTDHVTGEKFFKVIYVDQDSGRILTTILGEEELGIELHVPNNDQVYTGTGLASEGGAQ